MQSHVKHIFIHETGSPKTQDLADDFGIFTADILESIKGPSIKRNLS